MPSDSNGVYRLPSGYLPDLVIVGIGTTIVVAPLAAVVLDCGPDGQSGIVSGINNAVARAAGLIAVVALGLYFGGTAPAHAYRLVMLASVALAGLGALVAAVTIEGAAEEKKLNRKIIIDSVTLLG